MAPSTAVSGASTSVEPSAPAAPVSLAPSPDVFASPAAASAPASAATAAPASEVGVWLASAPGFETAPPAPVVFPRPALPPVPPEEPADPIEPDPVEVAPGSTLALSPGGSGWGLRAHDRDAVRAANSPATTSLSRPQRSITTRA